MGTFRDVSKSEPCPICGKTDWCTIMKPSQELYPGQELYICRRVQQSTITANGVEYRFIKELSDGSSLYGIKTNIPIKKNLDTYIRIHSSKEQNTNYPNLKDNELLDKIYRSFLNLLTLSSNHTQKLLKDGWTHELIIHSSIRSLHLKKSFDSCKKCYTDSFERIRLTKVLYEKYGDLDGVPGFYQDDNNNWTFVGRNGMLIPLYDLQGRIYRLRLRLDKPDLDENGKERNKYKNFSSYHCEENEKGILTNIYSHGSRAGSCIGLYYHPSTDMPTVCYVTEGEKKAILANYVLKYPVISLPGTGTYKKLHEKQEETSAISFLKFIGCKEVVVAYDADKIYNQQVKRYEEKLIELLLEEQFSVYVADWNIGFGKGLDDILAIGILPNLTPVEKR